MSLKEKIKQNSPAILLYGFTPPNIDTDEKKVEQIAATQLLRLVNSQLDGLVIYDLQDEKERNKDKRTFDFKDTLEPLSYYKNYFASKYNAVIYKAVSKYTPEALADFLSQNAEIISVFVGASSKNDTPKTHLNEAYEIKAKNAPNIALGGICIPERHISKGDEHLRVGRKIELGCEFFITQAVYNINNAKHFLSDYAKLCAENSRIKKVPIIFTFTPCGDAKTLSFMRWLGIDVPKYFEQRLMHSSNPVSMSVQTSFEMFCELYHYGKALGISIGANVESISRKKVEIEASIELLNNISDFIKKEIN